MQKAILYTDGGARGNPGPAAAGVVITDETGSVLKEYGEYLGERTNNEAEYQAIIFGLKKLKLLFGKEKTKGLAVLVRADSELLVKQLNHEYKIKEERIGKLFLEAWNLMIDFKNVEIEHVRREANKEADRLVNEVLDKKQGTLY